MYHLEPTCFGIFSFSLFLFFWNIVHSNIFYFTRLNFRALLVLKKNWEEKEFPWFPMEYHSICLDLWFLSFNFCSFSHLERVYILLEPYLSTWASVDNMSCVAFKFQSLIVHWWYLGKQIYFCILTLHLETLLLSLTGSRNFCWFLGFFYIANKLRKEGVLYLPF